MNRVGQQFEKPFAKGTRLAFNQSAAPVGWTKDTDAALNDSILRIVTGSVGSGGANGFSSVNAQSVVGATTLTESQIPAHTHVQDSHNHTQNSHNHTQTNGTLVLRGTGGSQSISASAGTTGAATLSNVAATATNQAATATNQDTGGGDAHDHTITMNIKYNDFIIASKN